MVARLNALCVDANDPTRMARFWADVLGWDMDDDVHTGMAVLPNDDTGFRFRFRPTQEQKVGPNQMHFHLTSTSLENQQQTVERSLFFGARHLDVGQLPEEGHGGNRHPGTPRWSEDRLGRTAGAAEDRDEPDALRSRPTRRWRPACRGRPSTFPRGDPG